jgi:uncharacterized repeat protein (TIGR02543 family)
MTSKQTKDIVVLSDGTILATAWGGGVFRSTDGGELWVEANSGLTQLSIYCLRKSSADHVFAGSFGGGVFRSMDKGLTWTALPLSGYIYDLGVRDDGVLFAISNNMGVFRSSDNGDTWIKSDQGLPGFSGYGFLFRSHGEILVSPGSSYGMYRSTDDGATWSAFNDGYSLTYVQGSFMSTAGDCYAMTYGDGVYELPRDSSRWRPRNEGMQGSFLYTIEAVTDSAIFCGGYGGVRVSRDQGNSWSYACEGLDTYRITDLLYAKQILFAAANRGGVYRSTDLGLHWIEINNGMTSDQAQCLAVDGSGIMYCGTEGNGVFSSSDNGDNWTEINNGLSSLRIYALCADPASTMFAATDGGVFKSTDQGANWSLASAGLPSGNIISVLSANGVVFAGTGGSLYRSSDGGSNWLRVGETQLPGRPFYSLKADAGNVVYAVCATGLFSSSDNGDTWVDMDRGQLPEFARDVAWDSHGRFYVVTETKGAYRSLPNTTTAEITIRTNPEGRSFTVDGTVYSSTQSFSWQPASAHTISTVQTQNGATGVRYIWSSWSDGGALSHTITPQAGAQTITADFRTEHQLQMIADGAGSVTPQTGWYNPSAVVTIQANPDGGQTFNGWEGSGAGSYTGTDNPASVTMNGPITQTAHFTGGGSTREITITASPPGRRITVDGETITGQKSYEWTVGSTHAIGTVSPQTGSPGLRYVWKSWSTGEAITHDWTVPAGQAMTITAAFDMEYQLTTVAGNGGSVQPASSWYGVSEQVQLIATPQAGYVFDRWEGTGPNAYSGTQNPITITMTNPLTETAHFTQVNDIDDDVPSPADVVLQQNAPNPFSSETAISFSLPRAARVALIVSDLLGHEVMRLTDGVEKRAGEHRVVVNLSSLPAGVYIYRLETNDAVRTRMMVRLR